MKKIKLIPLKGIEIEDIGFLPFGMNREEVIQLLGSPSEEEKNAVLYENLECKIDFNGKNKIEFFEFYSPNEDYPYELSLYGVNPFRTTAKELLKLVRPKNPGKVDDLDAPYFYMFWGSSIGLWREDTEDDVRNDIKEAKANGEYEEWMDEEFERAKYFLTVGLGERDYYKF